VAKFQKGVSNLGAKVFNMLPSYIKIESDNPKKFKLVLQKFFYENYFSSLDEYFQSRKVKGEYTYLVFDTQRGMCPLLFNCILVSKNQFCIYNYINFSDHYLLSQQVPLEDCFHM
jgi:cellulose biosynthesis protein BcsQ